MRTLLSFADAVGAVTGTSKKFLESLGELRNTLVHDIANTSFRLSEWAGHPDGASRLATLMGPDASLVEIAPPPLDKYRFVLWARAISVLAELQGATAAHSAAFRAHVDSEVARRARVEAELTQQALQEMLAEDAGEPD